MAGGKGKSGNWSVYNLHQLKLPRDCQSGLLRLRLLEMEEVHQSGLGVGSCSVPSGTLAVRGAAGAERWRHRTILPVCFQKRAQPGSKK